MEVEKELDALHSEIMCEHKLVYAGESFFHNHDGYELFLLLKGDVNYYVERDGYRLLSGGLLCIRPYAFHRRELNSYEHYDRIVINVKEQTMKQFSSNETDLTNCFYHPTINNMSIVWFSEQELSQYVAYAKHLENALHTSEYGNDILAEVYTKMILVMVNRHFHEQQGVICVKNIMPELVAAVIDYVERHISEDITLKGMAEYFHHNRTYISRCFKNVTGITLQQYILDKKVVLARNYLKEGYAPYEVCCMTGFNNYSNFSRTFTQRTGISPKKYQMKH